MSALLQSHTQSPEFPDFPNIPPFPHNVPTVPLIRLSLKKLRENDYEESQRFFQTSKDLGFFYLDLRDCAEGQALLGYADKLFGVGEKLFDRDLNAFDLSDEGSYFGYKGYGKGTIDKDGTKDRNELYNISKDDMLSLSAPIRAPPFLTPYRPLLASYIRSSQSIVDLLLVQLNTHLQLPPGTLSSLHRIDHPSGDQVRFVKAPPQPPSDSRTALGAHTDFGSLTILFNRLGGLQVLPPFSSEWKYVRPLLGHAIINLGDALAKFSNGLLRSNIHRVVSPPGEQAQVTRYSLVYFSRPEDDVLLRRLESSVIPELGEGVREEVVDSKTWVLRRAMARRGRNKEAFLGTEGGRL